MTNDDKIRPVDVTRRTDTEAKLALFGAGTLVCSVVLSKCLKMADGSIGIFIGVAKTLAAVAYAFAFADWQLYAGECPSSAECGCACGRRLLRGAPPLADSIFFISIFLSFFHFLSSSRDHLSIYEYIYRVSPSYSYIPRTLY